MIIYNHRKNKRPDGEYERMIPMKCKMMTWDEFREMCREDAESWYYNGYSSDELTAEDILNEYEESFFSDNTDDEYDALTSYFTPDEVAQKTLDYLEEMEG